MRRKILLVNPPIYDFAAYDFWLEPYGLLSVAGFFRGQADFLLFDYLDREHESLAGRKDLTSNQWGQGRFHCEQISTPGPLVEIPRYFRRFGLPRNIFRNFLTEAESCEFAFVQTMMTYWYPGVTEVIEDIRRIRPETKIILGGNYVTLCSGHAQRLGADLVVRGAQLKPLWEYLGMMPDFAQPALWEAYRKLKVGVLKVTEGCPFSCTYCSVPKVYGRFKVRSLSRSLGEYEMLSERGVENIAFYDDALLYETKVGLEPFLEKISKLNGRINLHTPNAINVRFLTKPLAELMIKAGFKTFYLGFESVSGRWHRQTGSKTSAGELEGAVAYLTGAGAKRGNITAYQILGHPKIDIQQLESSMRFVNDLGIRGMLADFSPIPGTPDGKYCEKFIEMDEPLLHNKTAFPIILLGNDEVNRLKDLQRQLNRRLSGDGPNT